MGNETAATTVDVTIYWQSITTFGTANFTITAGNQASWTFPSGAWINTVQVGPSGGNWVAHGCGVGTEYGAVLINAGDYYCVVYSHPPGSSPGCTLGVRIVDSSAGAACP